MDLTFLRFQEFHFIILYISLTKQTAADITGITHGAYYGVLISSISVVTGSIKISLKTGYSSIFLKNIFSNINKQVLDA